jgi:hypothetical protein
MKRDYGRWEIMFVGVVFTAGLALRLRLALLHYLNPDEALQALLAFGTWGDALRNSLQVTHPPLLIVIRGLCSRACGQSWKKWRARYAPAHSRRQPSIQCT